MEEEIFEATVAYNEARYDDALTLLTPFIQAGEPRAQFLFGQMNFYGLGVNQDAQKGLELISASAKAGFQFAQVRLAWIYIDEYDRIEQALELLTDAAEHGDPTAQNDLGHLLLGESPEVDQDLSGALHYLNLASEGGSVESQLTLGNLYSSGRLIPRDVEISLKYLLLAHYAGDARASFALTGIYLDKKAPEFNRDLGIRYLIVSAQKGLSIAQANLGALFANGDIIARDYVQALYWYKKAAEQQDPIAQNNISIMYFNGLGVEKDIETALMWLYASRLNGNEDAAQSIIEIEAQILPESRERARQRAQANIQEDRSE
jgi:TPR repeat protein